MGQLISLSLCFCTHRTEEVACSTSNDKVNPAVLFDSGFDRSLQSLRLPHIPAETQALPACSITQFLCRLLGQLCSASEDGSVCAVTHQRQSLGIADSTGSARAEEDFAFEDVVFEDGGGRDREVEVGAFRTHGCRVAGTREQDLGWSSDHSR